MFSKKISRFFKKASALVGMIFCTLYTVAPATLVSSFSVVAASSLISGTALAQNAGTDSSVRLDEDATKMGIFKDSTKLIETVKFINYILLAAGLIPCVLFFIMCARSLNKEDYGPAFASFLAAAIAGGGGYLAFVFVK